VSFPRRRQPHAEGIFTFRPWVNIAACAFWAVFGVIWLAGAAGSGWSSVLHQVPTIALISTVVYAVFGRPRVIVGDYNVLLRNVTRDVSIPYGAISEISTQYALTITTIDGGRHQAWAAPAGGRIRAARVTEEERRALTWSGPVDEIPSSAALRSDAGAAAVAIRRRWQQSPTNGRVNEHAPPMSSAQVEVRWATGVLVALGVFTLATIVAGLWS
jgi:hypothetical protein